MKPVDYLTTTDEGA